MSEMSLAELKRREITQARLERKRTYFNSFQVGETVEFYIKRGKTSFTKTIGEIIATTARYITLVYITKRGYKRKETIGLGDFLTGSSKIKRIGGDSMPPRIDPPPAEEILAVYEKEKSIRRVAKHFNIATGTAEKWLKIARKKAQSKEDFKEEPWRSPDYMKEFEVPAAESVPGDLKLDNLTWFTASQRFDNPCFYASKEKMKLNAAAARLIDMNVRERLSVGINESVIVLKIDPDNGFRTWPMSRSTVASIFRCLNLAREMERLGWPIPCRVPVELRDGMLVGRRP